MIMISQGEKLHDNKVRVNVYKDLQKTKLKEAYKVDKDNVDTFVRERYAAHTQKVCIT